MVKVDLTTLGQRVAKRRGGQGIRATAKEIGVSPATLSRIERGYLPDLETFRKVCDWLQIDPGEVLGSKVAGRDSSPAAVHFKKDAVIKPETASALANMILAAQRALTLKKNGP